MSQPQRPSFARPNQHQHASGLTLGDAPPRPIEPDLKNANVPLTFGSVVTDFSDLLSKEDSVRPPNGNDGFLRNPPRQQQDPLYHWATSHGPWDPVHGRASDVFRPEKSFYPQHGAVSFSGYRSYASPSECETTGPGHLPSDSGYGSAPRQSVIDGSIYEDCNRSADAESVSSHFAGIHIERPIVAPSEVWNQQASAHNEVPVIAQPNKFVCQYCHIKVKTKSELKKHDQKHTKPHHCKIPDCSRTEGFSTPNDVDRHMRSCHPEFGTKGKYYKCTEENCRNKDKKWPRADNFRQHLKRVHQIQPAEDDIERYVCGPQLSPGPDLAGLTTIEHGLIPLDIDHNGTLQDSWSFNLQSAQQGGPKDPCGIYLEHQMDNQMDRQMEHQMDHQMDHQIVFQPEVAVQQHFEAMARGHLVPSNLMQMSPIEQDIAPLTNSSGVYAPSQGLQNISSSDAQETNFEEASYFNETISDDEVEDDNQSIIHHVSEPASSSSEDVCEGSRLLERPASRDSEAPTVADDGQNGPPSHNIITLDDNDSSSTRSSSPNSNASAGDDLMQVSPDAATSSSSHMPEAALDFSDVIKDKTKAYDLIKALKEQGLLAELLERVEYQGAKDAEPNVITPLGRDVGKISHACPEVKCDKSFPRPCELKKHMKRHAKPYGCTFPRCDKRFGSKNDWKRHENSQHFQLELWKCNEKSKFGASALCSKAFNRREHFKTHLARDHRIVDSADVDRKLEDCLDERNYEVTFWCGFCKKMVHVKERGLKAWLGRFNHIDAHFSGQMDISDWKDPDPSLREVDVVLVAPSETSHSGSQNTASALPTGAESGGRPSKRAAEGGVQHSRPPKKARQSALWYCCLCQGQQLAGFTAACLTPSCGGHEQCDECELETIPLNSDDQVM